MANWSDPASTKSIGMAQHIMDQKIQWSQQSCSGSRASAARLMMVSSNYHQGDALLAMAQNISRQRRTTYPMVQQGHYPSSSRMLAVNERPRLQSGLFLNKTLSFLQSHAAMQSQTSLLPPNLTAHTQASWALEMAQRQNRLHEPQLKQQTTQVNPNLVVFPSNRDVLLGRGGRSNNHAGNERFRELIRTNREQYNALPKHEKIRLSRTIVGLIQEFGGRFLEPAGDGGYFVVVPDKRAVEKTSQCLREKRSGDNKFTAAIKETSRRAATAKPTGTTFY